MLITSTYSFFPRLQTPEHMAHIMKRKKNFLWKNKCASCFSFKKSKVLTWQYVLENTVADICQISCCQQ